MRGKRKSDPTDAVVGRNVRIYRLKKKMSQTDLGNSLGVTFQQVQKYEKGTNRVGSGRLMQIARILDVPITAFFEGSETKGGRVPGEPSPFDQLSDPQTLRMVEAFSAIKDPHLKRSLLALVSQIVTNKASD